jgi:hypothetical protein
MICYSSVYVSRDPGDGLCCQLSGELIFATASTGADRTAHRYTYIRSLEDTAFLILFSPSLGVAGNMPQMQNAYPGQDFPDYLSSRTDNVVQTSFSGLQTLESILAENECRVRIAAQLGHVGRAFLFAPQYWYDLLEREAMTFLGTHRSIMRESFDESAPLVFDRPAAYIQDPELAEKLDLRCVEQIARQLVNLFPEHHFKALCEFVLKVIVTHFAISEGYDRAAEDFGAFRLPAVTRTQVRRLVLRNSPAHEHRVILDLTRDALSFALKGMRGSPRQIIIDRLVDLRERDNIKRYRGMIVEYTEAMRVGDRAAAAVALRALDEAYDVGEDVVIDETQGSGAFLRRLRFAGYEYPDTLYKVFLELRPQDDSAIQIPPMKYNDFRNATIGHLIQGGYGHQTTTNVTVNNLATVREIVAEAKLHSAELSPANGKNGKTLDQALAEIQEQLTHEDPKPGLLREGLASIRQILEHATAIIIGHEWLPLLLQKVESAIKALQG